MSKNLEIRVQDKIATLVNNETLVCRNNDYTVTFDFDSDWDAYNVKTALFIFDNKTIKKVFEGNVCEGVAIENSTICHIGVMAGDIVTSTNAEVKCRFSIADLGDTPTAPTEDVYNQIMALLNKYIEQGGGNGGYTKEEIEQIVADYLEANMPSLVSPTVAITSISNGYRIVITDVNGAHSFEIFNGTKGDKGDTGAQGQKGDKGDKGDTGAHGYTPKRGTDYWTSDDVATIEAHIDSQINSKLGDLEASLDEIIALQDYYTGATFDELHEYATNVAEGGTQ